MLKYISSIKDDNFWKVCLKVARENPELSAEEVEFKAAQIIKKR